MRVIGLQFDIVWETPRQNFEIVTNMLDSADISAGSLLVLPEMFATGFSMETDITAGFEDKTAYFLSYLARTYDVHVCAGLAAGGAKDKALNQAIMLGRDGHTLGRYTKIHPFAPAGEDEAYHAGDEVLVCKIDDAAVSPLICYDLRFPETFRQAQGQGAEVFLVIASWPAVRDDHWQTLLRARAIENQAYVVGVNRCGTDPNCEYAGRSVIIDPRGQTLAQADGENQMLQKDLDLADLREYRKRFPVLQDIR